MKFNLKNRPQMKCGNMDRCLFMGHEVEDWFNMFESELQAFKNHPQKNLFSTDFWNLLTEILGEN